jgi:ubiquinone/menaquinone biosynthesis C-methylase UbiE
MNRDSPRQRIHVVKWRTPLGDSISPYLNKLQTVRQLSYMRFQAALDLAHPNPAACVLELGCWDGHFLPSLLNHFHEVWGVDDDSASVVEMLPGYWTILQLSRRLCESELGSVPRLGLTKATALALPFRDRHFDVVFCIDTLTHVQKSRRLQVINELRRITKPEGQLIFSLPVEIGPIHLLREAARTLTHKRIDQNSRKYDFRADLELLRSSFAVCTAKFIPVNALGALNPAVLVDCRIVVPSALSGRAAGG